MKSVPAGILLTLAMITSMQAAAQTAVPVSRAQAQARAGETFNQLDFNHDGKLDAADAIAQMFNRIDTNHDGQISRAEFAAAQRPAAGRAAGGPADTNHDNALSQNEFVTAAMRQFDAVDANRDGVVSVQEQQAAQAAAQAAAQRRAGK